MWPISCGGAPEFFRVSDVRLVTKTKPSFDGEGAPKPPRP
jgi:hypothetical protein